MPVKLCFHHKPTHRIFHIVVNQFFFLFRPLNTFCSMQSINRIEFTEEFMPALFRWQWNINNLSCILFLSKYYWPLYMSPPGVYSFLEMWGKDWCNIQGIIWLVSWQCALGLCNFQHVRILIKCLPLDCCILQILWPNKIWSSYTTFDSW